MLYSRMAIVMVMNLYLSRVLLNALGVNDFGIYNVVGGVALLFSFLNGTLSGSTSRFLIYQRGKNTVAGASNVFDTALSIHIAIGIVVLILGETLGLWFVENRLVIPSDKINSARIVLHTSVFICFVQLIQIPYNALVVSYEKMNIYAYVSIVEVTLKASAVYMVVVCDADKLVVFSILTCISSLIIFFSYKIYCNRVFEESRYSFSWDDSMLRPMLSFSGWDLYGNLSWTLSAQSASIILNLFFGSPINAACAIAGQVRNAVSGFSTNFITAVRPQIIKSYSTGNIDELVKLINQSSKFSFLLLYFISFPLILENHFILKLWLGTVPNYATLFCQLSLIASLVNSLFYSIGIGIHATGRLKKISFLTGTIYLVSVPFSYFLMRGGLSPETPFLLSIFTLVVASVSNLLILKQYISRFSLKDFIKEAILVAMMVVVSSSVLPIFFLFHMQEGYFRFILVTTSCLVCVPVSVYFFALDSEMQISVVNRYRNLYRKLCAQRFTLLKISN